jgi:hypothetical protein
VGEHEAHTEKRKFSPIDTNNKACLLAKTGFVVSAISPRYCNAGAFCVTGFQLSSPRKYSSGA